MSYSPTKFTPDGLDRCDLLIIGGGINGCGIARDAAGRGLKVILVERGDLAGATSMASSKLVHGGLRYLEQGKLRLVRESLAEREVLLHVAAHLLTPMRFILPHSPALRPAWMLRVGLSIYDHLGGRSSLPASESIPDLRRTIGETLKPEYQRGFAYSDCAVDDARLVIANAIGARDKGARVLTRTHYLDMRAAEGAWKVRLSDGSQIAAQCIVNAAGPWVGEVLRHALGAKSNCAVRLVKGSHIVVPRRHPGPQAFILQNVDRRVVFLLPFETHFTLIGTTDFPVTDVDETPRASRDEIDYLCAAANKYLAQAVTADEVVWSYSGVRALYDDGKDNLSEVTRDYVLQLDRAASGAPILSVFGGKITTYRKLAEEALNKLRPVLRGAGDAWTHGEPLPGSDFGDGGRSALSQRLMAEFSFIAPQCISGMVARHGTGAEALLDNVRRASQLGAHFGAGLTAKEVDHFLEREWAHDADDVMWRRSKTGLHLTEVQRDSVREHIAARSAN
jgi:glycerol-3-phosphate dehydrogenase